MRQAFILCSRTILGLVLIVTCAAGAGAAADQGPISGIVVDAQGRAVAGAAVSLLTARQVALSTRRTDNEGRFDFGSVPRGSYLLVVAAPGFSERRVAVKAPSTNEDGLPVRVTLDVAGIESQVTVTAYPGAVEEVQTVAQAVNVITGEEIRERVQAVTAQMAQEEPGVQLQRTSPTIAGIYVRGVTGSKVNLYLDGVRFTTSSARGGISTFLNLVEPAALDTVEVLRGPAGAQYGSDAIGGSVQFLTPSPALAANGVTFRGNYGTLFNSADASYGTHVSLSAAGRKLAVLTTLAGRRTNRLRPGKGIDSHSALTRFLGLPSTVLGDNRLSDTAFTQYSGMTKLTWAPARDANLIVNYSRSQQDGGKRYDQLLGGDGNLLAGLHNLMLDLFYARFDKVRPGWLDSLTAIYSFNAQREERVNQGGSGDPNAAINHEYEKTRAHGFQAFGSKQIGKRNAALGGAEYYHERITSPSYGFDPVTRSVALRRPRVPDNALYRLGGAYAQDIFQLWPRRVHVVGNLRWNYASYHAKAVDDSLRVSAWTYRAGITGFPGGGVSLSANFSRGFRAPNMTDLGTLGLTGTGFEVSSREVAGLGATIGTTAGSDAVSTGRPVAQLAPETSQSYELTARYRTSRFDVEATGFVNDLKNEVAKHALILPLGAIGRRLGSEPIISQLANGVVFVAAAANPVLVRANFDAARSYGFEHEMELKLARGWLLRTVSSFARIKDAATGLPSNISGGSPAADGYVMLRYTRPGGKWWIEPYVHAAERQEHLSSLALEDRRTGAMRTRTSIRNFFFNGAAARGLVAPGRDGAPGNSDDILVPTGETLAQVQDRVLGPGREFAPLFPAVPGYATVNLRGGFRLSERQEILVNIENIGDRNYRGVNWGLDAPGRGVSVRYFARF